MDERLKADVISILNQGQDLTLATLREDGWPQATTVSYASQGLDIYFGCDARSQKARNLARDDRVSATVDLPYANWGQIHCLSLGGRARRLTDPEEIGRVGALFFAKFPQMGDYMTASDGGELALFQITPQVISVLDYRQGFGHHDVVQAAEPVV